MGSIAETLCNIALARGLVSPAPDMRRSGQVLRRKPLKSLRVVADRRFSGSAVTDACEGMFAIFSRGARK